MSTERKIGHGEMKSNREKKLLSCCFVCLFVCCAGVLKGLGPTQQVLYHVPVLFALHIFRIKSCGFA